MYFMDFLYLLQLAFNSHMLARLYMVEKVNSQNSNSNYRAWDQVFLREPNQLHLQKPLKGVVYRNQYIFGLPAEIWGSRRRIQGHPRLSAPTNSEPWGTSFIQVKKAWPDWARIVEDNGIDSGAYNVYLGQKYSLFMYFLSFSPAHFLTLEQITIAVCRKLRLINVFAG